MLVRPQLRIADRIAPFGVRRNLVTRSYIERSGTRHHEKSSCGARGARGAGGGEKRDEGKDRGAYQYPSRKAST